MPPPHDRAFVSHPPNSPEDPLGFFLPENQNEVPEVPVPPVRAVPAVQMPPRRRDRRPQILSIAPVARFLAVIVAASRAAVRFTVATYGHARPVIRQISTRTLVSAATIYTFACGVVVGGLALWLSGPSRHVNVESTASRHAPHQVQRAEASPVVPVATASANHRFATARANVPVVRNTDAETEPLTTAAGSRTPQFRGSLVVNSRPPGARVFVNGQRVGETPLVLKNQLAGSRAIRVALDGYEPWSAAVQVVADTETRLSPELKAQTVATQP
jgi:hypothetical protein